MHERIFPSGVWFWLFTLICITCHAQAKVHLCKATQSAESKDFPIAGVAENGNLHALAGKDIEFVISTVPEFLEFAEEIAEIHRCADRIKVAVVTPTQVYNEFSHGVPDPMAYRAFMKMLYEGDGKRVKNLMLLGPSTGDYLNPENPLLPYSAHIAFQSHEPDPSKEPAPVYDLYGMVGDSIDTTALYLEDVMIGVGVVNCVDSSECRRYIRKLKRYISSSDEMARYLNDLLSIGGSGDLHSHDRQAIDFSNLVRSITSGNYAVSNLSVDSYGYEDARRRFLSKLNEGKLLTVYLGHADTKFIDSKFFTTSDIRNLRNGFTGFGFLAGCNFSFPDRGIRGIGEDLIYSTDQGFISAIMSCRNAMSVSNYRLLKNFTDTWLKTEWDEAPTIGEVYARTKSKSKFKPAQNYFLAGDPMIKLPVATKCVKAAIPKVVIPGSKIRFKGVITDRYGKPEATFRGKGVVKIMKPNIEFQSLDYITNTHSAASADRDTLTLNYSAERILVMEFDVKNGEFDVEMPIPIEYNEYEGRKLSLHFSAYNSDSGLGASGFGQIDILVDDKDPQPEGKDTLPPEVGVSYDETSQLLHIFAADNIALSLTPSIFEISIDGRSCTPVADYEDRCRDIGKGTSVSVDVMNLAEGNHSVKIKCTDIAGNCNEIDYKFLKGEICQPDIALSLSSKAITDSLTVKASGVDNEEIEVTIVNSKGERVIRRNMKDGIFIWDCRDENGKPVSPGLYRVKAVSMLENGVRRYSAWETMAVLQ